MTDQLPADIAEAIDKMASFAARYALAKPSDQLASIELSQRARAALEAVILKHLGQTSDPNLQMVKVPRLFDAEAEDKAWQVWREGGRHHEAFINCINAYVEAAAVPATDLGRSALADEGRGT